MNYINKDKKYIQKKDLQYILIELALVCISMIIITFIIGYIPEIDALKILSIWGNVIFLISIVNWFMITGKIICPYILFFCSFFMYHFGQAFLLGIGCDINTLPIYSRFTYENLIEAHSFSVISMAMFSLGALTYICIYKNNKNKINCIYENKITYTMKLIGGFIFILSAPIAFNFAIKVAISSIKNGYFNAYINIQQSGIINILINLFIPSVIMLIIANHKKEKMRNSLILILVFYGLINLIIGTRTTFVSILLVLFWYYSKFIRKINFFKLFIYLIMGFILLIFINSSIKIRDMPNKNLNVYKQVLENNIKDNPIKGMIKEFGGSMETLINVQQITEEENLKYGESYVASFFALIPESIVGKVTGNSKLISSKASLDSWLMNRLNLDYGPGFSMCAEAYYNFGNMGVLAIGILGYIIASILNWTTEEFGERSIISLFINMSFLALMFTLPRRQNLDLVFYGFRYIMIPIILIFMTSRIKVNKKNKV